VSGRYSDWQLPTLKELQKMNTNRIAIGGFSSAAYWSSTEVDTGNAYRIYIYSSNTPDSQAKTVSGYVRTIRYF